MSCASVSMRGIVFDGGARRCALLAAGKEGGMSSVVSPPCIVSVSESSLSALSLWLGLSMMGDTLSVGAGWGEANQLRR